MKTFDHLVANMCRADWLKCFEVGGSQGIVKGIIKGIIIWQLTGTGFIQSDWLCTI